MGGWVERRWCASPGKGQTKKHDGRRTKLPKRGRSMNVGEKRARDESPEGGEQPQAKRQTQNQDRGRALFYTLPQTSDVKRRTTLLAGETVRDFKTRLCSLHGIPETKLPVIVQRCLEPNGRELWARLDHEDDLVERLLDSENAHFRIDLDCERGCTIQ